MEITVEEIIHVLNENVENVCFNMEHIHENIESFGIDSIAFIGIVVSLEEKFEVIIPNECLLLEKMNTIEKIYHLIKSLKQG